MVLDFSSLRQRLSFGPDADGDAGGDIRGWLDGISGKTPMEAAVALAEKLPPAIAAQPNLHMRTRILDHGYRSAMEVLPTLESEVSHALLPLTSPAKRAALAADNLIKALIATHVSIVAAITDRHLAAGLGHLLQPTLLRAIELLSRRQALAYRAYANPSAASWQQMHRLHAIARREHLGGVDKHGQTIDAIYVRALLLAFADPTKHSRANLESLHACVDCVSPLARLRPVGDIAPEGDRRGLFLLPAEEGVPGRPYARNSPPAPADALVLDASAALDEIGNGLAAIEPLLPFPQEILQPLTIMWSGKSNRRFSRARFRPRAELVAGVDGMAEYLQRAFARRHGEPGEQSDLAISEWQIIDESPDGFGLRFIKGDSSALDVGDLVALRTRERSRVHICIIRRVNTSSPGRLELGLQGIAPLALPIPLPVGSARAIRHGIFLPRMPGHTDAAGLAAPAGLLSEGSEVVWERHGRSIRHRLGMRIDGNSRTDLFLIHGSVSPVPAAGS